MLILLIVYPTLMVALLSLGYYSRLRSHSRLRSFAIATLSGAAVGLTASLTMDLVLSYDYFMQELITGGIPFRQIVSGAIPGAALSAAGWKARGDVERRQMK